MTTGTNWRDHAACMDADPDLVFPIGTTGPTLDQIDQAKRICLACPVREPCLAWALAVGAAAGILGGTAEDERRALRRAAASHRNRARKTAIPEYPRAGCPDHQDHVTRTHQPGQDNRVPARTRREAGHDGYPPSSASS